MRSTENGNAICSQSLLGATRCFFAPNGSLQQTAASLGLGGGSDACLDHWLCAWLRSYDLLGVGLVVCDPEGHVVGSNSSANSLLKAADGLGLSDAGELCVARGNGPATPKSLLEAINRARLDQSDVAMLVKRSGNKPAVTVIVKAAIPKARWSSPFTLLLLIDPSLALDNRVPVLQRRYGFSLEESYLANLLAEGLTLDECCDELAISNAKARHQLAGLLQKTGARRESELIALINRGGDGDLI
jgi:DNA-binding CsgD family transcriptional regulator